MRKRIVLHGSLKERFPEWEGEASTIAEAVEAWSRQTDMGEIPLDERPVLRIVGCETEDDLYAANDNKEIHIALPMHGGGGKFWTQIGIAAAFIALSFIPGIGQTMQVALLTSGITMGLMAVVGLFFKAPTISKSEDPEASKYLGSGENTTKIGTLIPIGYGRMRLGGHFLSLQVNANDLLRGRFPDTPPA